MADKGRYFEGGISSVYLWDMDDGLQRDKDMDNFISMDTMHFCNFGKRERFFR